MHNLSTRMLSNLLPAVACAVTITLIAGCALAAAPHQPSHPVASNPPVVTVAGCVEERVGPPQSLRSVVSGHCTGSSSVLALKRDVRRDAEASSLAMTSVSSTPRRIGPPEALRTEHASG